MKTWLACLLVTASFAAASRADAQASKSFAPGDFAYGIELTSSVDAPVQTVLVPLAVYRGALRPDLGDLRLFNAAGEPLPHALRKLADPAPIDRPIAEREQPVALFPLLAPADAPAAAVDKLALRIERGASGSVIDIRSAPPDAAADGGTHAATRVIAYVLDTQAIERDMVSLRVRLEEPPQLAGQSYLASVVIEVSEDLASWRSVVLDGVLARLSHGGQLVTRDRIDLGGIRAKFLRVRSVAGEDIPGRIAEAFIEVAQTEAPARPLEALRVRGQASPEPGVFDYDLGGAFPVERLRVLLPSTGMLFQAEVSVAAAKGETERPDKVSAIRARTNKRIYDDVYDGPIYRLLKDGREIESAPVELDGHRVRYVSITVADSATLAEPPQIEVEYLPAQLLFVAREPAPFTLAYGNYAAEPSKMTADALLAPFRASTEALPASTAQLGATKTLAGQAALIAPPPPAPIKTYVLWAVLIAGTLGITGLAIRLLRKLD
jgi:hypothetical protein